MNAILDKLDKLSISSFDQQISSYEIGTSHMVDITHINSPQSFYVRQIRKPKGQMDLQILVSHCRLANCPAVDDIWKDGIVNVMKDCIGCDKVSMTIRGKTSEQLIVQLKNTHSHDVATLLASMCTTMGFGRNPFESRMDSPQPVKRFPVKKRNVGEKLKVRVMSVDSQNNFYVAELDDFEMYLDEVDEVTYYSRRQPALTSDNLKEELIVVCLMQNNKYERAIIKQVTKPGESALVQLVDWGIIMEVHIRYMKKMSSKLFYLPVTAIHCSLDETQAWINCHFKYLYPGRQFFITIKKVGYQNAPYFVNISET